MDGEIHVIANRLKLRTLLNVRPAHLRGSQVLVILQETPGKVADQLMMNKKQILIVVGLVEPSVDTSDIQRLRNLMQSRGGRWVLWGWDCAHFCNIGHGKSRGPLLSKIVIFTAYFWWSIRTFFRALFNREQALYYGLMLEGALPVAAAGLFRNIPFVFANMDNAPLMRNWSPAIKTFVESLESFVAGRAAAHVLPAPERWQRQDANVHYVQNTPCRHTFHVAEQIAVQRGFNRDGALTIYANGWLGSVRGLDVLMNAARGCKQEIRVILAGKLASPQAEALANSEFCEYLGLLKHEEALAYYSRAHLVFSYYDPCYAIDRLASSGKWAECVLSGVPFIVNTEVETANNFRREGACFSTRYHDVGGLSALLDRLAADRTELERVTGKLASFHVGFWDDNMAVVLKGCGLDLCAGESV